MLKALGFAPYNFGFLFSSLCYPSPYTNACPAYTNPRSPHTYANTCSTYPYTSP